MDAAQQPTINLPLFEKCKALIDSGSMLPMWIKQRNLLEALNAKKTDESQTILTAAGRVTGDIYRMDLSIGDITYPQLPVLYNPITSKKLENVYLVLAAPMFRGMSYEIDAEHGRLNITIYDDNPVRQFKIVNDDGITFLTLAN